MTIQEIESKQKQLLSELVQLEEQRAKQLHGDFCCKEQAFIALDEEVEEVQEELNLIRIKLGTIKDFMRIDEPVVSVLDGMKINAESLIKESLHVACVIQKWRDKHVGM